MPARSIDPPRQIKLSIPGSVLTQVEVLLFDPVRAKREYGALSRLTTALYREWIEEQKGAQ